MRLSDEQKIFIYSYWKEKNVTDDLFLFGSRVDDNLRGGDIDILILSEKKISYLDIYKMKLSFFSKFHHQKIDIVAFEKDTQSSFKNYVLSYAKLLTV